MASAPNLHKLCTGELGRQITLINEQWIKKDMFMPGLLVLRMIIRYFATDKGPDACFSVKDLEVIKVHTNNLEGLWNNWQHVLAGMKKIHDEDTQEFFSPQ